MRESDVVLGNIVAVARDWIDYGELATGILAALAAVVALVIALRSARDARTSAAAAEASASASREVARFAEQELELARREAEVAEAERRRRPELRLSLAAERHPIHDEDPLVILTVTMHNDGTRPAENAELRVGVGDPTASIDSVRTSYGSDPKPLPEHSGFAALGDGQPFGDWLYVSETHTLIAGAAVPRYFQVSGQPGMLAVAVRLFHADAPNQGAQLRARVNLNWRDDRPMLEDVGR